MEQITFQTFNCEVPDGIAVGYFSYVDPITTRAFFVREFRGKLPHEESLAMPVTDSAVRYFLHEVIPNGRLALYQLDEIVDILEVDPDLWRPVALIPSRAIPQAREEQSNRPGFQLMVDEAEYSRRMIFLPSLDACVRAVRNALDADVWVCSEEPIRRHTLTPNAQMDFRAKAMLEKLPNRESVMRSIRSIAQALSAQECLVIDALDETFTFQITDTSRQYPQSVRLLAHFDERGNPIEKGFARGRWRDESTRILGYRLQDFDGPAGRSNGQHPQFGQAVTYPSAQPCTFVLCSAFRKSHGALNRICGQCLFEGVSYWYSGNLIAGHFSAQASPGARALEVLFDRGRSFERIDSSEVPHFWQRLVPAIYKARNVESNSRPKQTAT